MKAAWKAAGLALGVWSLGGTARAHELACEKTVNGETYLEVKDFPVTLVYDLTVKNIHPTSPSEVLEATDPLLEDLGFGGFDTPFILGLGKSQMKEFEVELKDYEDCMALAAEDGDEDEYIDNVFTVRWDSGSEICSARVRCEKEGRPDGDGRRMTGGGSIGKGKDRVTHGFQLRCDDSDPRQNLEINWHQHRFHLLDLDSAICSDTALDEGHPVAGFDTFTGKGHGRFDGVDGATVEFEFTDAGEPGKSDTAKIMVHDKDDNLVLDVDGVLTFGNHQAHP